jgi:hypothetical protein
MKTFLDYLNEKITKKEFDEALNNSNIIGGCEFEFYLQDFFGNDEMIRKFNQEIKNFDKVLYQFEEDVKSFKKALDHEKDVYEKTISNYRKVESKIDELEALDSLTSKQEATLEKYKTMFDKMEVIIDDWENGDVEKNLENKFDIYPNVKHFKLDNLVLFIEELLFSTYNWSSKFESFIWEYMINYDYEVPSITEILDAVFDLDYDKVPEYIENMGLNIPSLKQLEDNYNFPIKLTNGWKVEEDGSLKTRRGGIEIITPTLPVKKLIETIDSVFKWMKTHAITDSSCGFHVHMSMVNTSPIDPLKLLLFTEEGKIYKSFEERVGSSYAESIRNNPNALTKGLDKKELTAISKGVIKTEKINMDKYLGVRMVELEKNHVEFRYMGDADYHKKFDEVRKLIVNYAHWVRIACDPNYKRQEYLTRVARLNQQYENQFYKVVFDVFYHIMVSNGWDKSHRKIINMVIKPYADKIVKDDLVYKSPNLIQLAREVALKLANYISVYITGKEMYPGVDKVKVDISPALVKMLTGK